MKCGATTSASATFEPVGQACWPNQLDDAGNASPARVADGRESRSSHQPRGSPPFDTFPACAVRRVDRDGSQQPPVHGSSTTVR